MCSSDLDTPSPPTAQNARSRENQAQEIAPQNVGAEWKDEPGIVWPRIRAVLHNEVDRLMGRDLRSKGRDDDEPEKRDQCTEDPRVRARPQRCPGTAAGPRSGDPERAAHAWTCAPEERTLTGYRARHRQSLLGEGHS